MKPPPHTYRPLNLSLARTNRTFVGRWWWTVDQWTLTAILVLLILGLFLVLAASTGIASRLTGDSFYFFKRQLLMVIPAALLLVGLSFLSPSGVRRAALLLFILSWGLLILTSFWGFEVKGAQRWIGLKGGFSLQPSELMKPALVVMCGWMFSEQKRLAQAYHTFFPGSWIAFAFLVVGVGPILIQPDVGMSLLIIATWGIQLFLAGLPLLLVVILGALTLGGGVGAYFFFPHVQARIASFWSTGPQDRYGDQFQILQSLEAFAQGGIWGRGPGEGIVKKALPDAHCDFIFAVAGEEFGLVLCFLILLLYGLIVIRCLLRIQRHSTMDFFVFYTGAGLSFQLGLQAFINMASTLHLIPPKGMTLPLISYGCSSLISAAITLGFLLALTRQRVQVSPPSPFA